MATENETCEIQVRNEVMLACCDHESIKASIHSCMNSGSVLIGMSVRKTVFV